MASELSVAEAADALGTSPQTVRALLRKGDLGGEKRAWGSRYVWVVHGASVDAFLSEHGRLDGRRRATRRETDEPTPDEATPDVPTPDEPTPHEPAPAGPLDALLVAAEAEEPPPPERPRSRWRAVFRVRVRATIVVLLVGIPALVAYVYAQLVPGALWFGEVGQGDVFQRVIEEQLDFRLRVLLLVALVIGANLLVACRGSLVTRRIPGLLAIVAGSLVVGNMFATAATDHLQTYLLWRHRQPFGEVDPLHGKDVGFFVFSLPFYLELAAGLLALVALTLVAVALVYRARGTMSFRPLRVGTTAQVHLAVLVAALLGLAAWRLQLQQYLLELQQPSATRPESFAGAGYVDVHVVAPILTALMAAALVLGALVLFAPLVARTPFARAGRLFVLGLLAAVVAVGGVTTAVVPHLVQRYVVDPNPLVREEPYLADSLSSTRAALGLDQVDIRQYEPGAPFDAADYATARERFRRVPTWDSYVLGARMRQLVTEPPYYRPDDPVPDVVTVHGRRQLTAVSARELDLSEVPSEGDAWVSDRLSYTHGLGLVRFSSTAVDANREPEVLDAGFEVPEPRIYFGDLPSLESDDDAAETQVRLLTPTLDEDVADSQWVIANTRRPEVDVPATEGADAAPYHYDGSGGIGLSSWARRAAFALALGSEELVLSDEITPDSRLLLHRDVHERLGTLAPFIHWDAEAVPLSANGRILFVIDGYTTSDSYPYAERVALGDDEASYARASVVATVDAFTGAVELYVTDDAEPVLRAWREIFPTLFQPFSDLPPALEGRLRYPAELFHAQATAYERYHTTEPDVFVSGADTWARPLALSGPIEVAGDVDFDEDDEDDLRLTMPPVYIWVPPPGRSAPRLVLATYYTPSRGQNLVGTLNGWIDDDGRARLAGLRLPRQPVILGPAQVSRLVFATPRVSNLLGLRNLEIRDLDKSSIDAVLLGRPRMLMLDGGRVQIQNLYEGSRGPGAARLLGVTAYVNGRAGLGPDVESAVRQALNEPPEVRILPVDGPLVIGRRTDLAFRVVNARREDVTISSAGGQVDASLTLTRGRGSVTWVPTATGEARIRVVVTGLDGTRTSDVATVEVLGPPPRLRMLDRPTEAEVGRPFRVRFEVDNAVSELAEISTRAGIVFSRRFDVRDGRAVVSWVPDATGDAELVLRVRGTEGQVVRKRLRLVVGPSTAVSPPTVTVTRVPSRPTVGQDSVFLVRADGCSRGLAQLTDPDGEVVQEWRFDCPADPARLVWTPTARGEFVLTATARGEGSTSQTSISVTVRRAE